MRNHSNLRNLRMQSDKNRYGRFLHIKTSALM